MPPISFGYVVHKYVINLSGNSAEQGNIPEDFSRDLLSPVII